MDWWQALILGIVEGITEFLPVSSTGHLLLAERLLGIPETDAAIAFAICIQAGAIVAVLGIFRQRVRQAWSGLAGLLRLAPRDERGVRLLRHLAIAFLPAMLFGLMFDDLIETYLMGLRTVAVAWFVGGVAILIIEFWPFRPRNRADDSKRGVDDITWPTALGIGLLQTVAMVPGTSRSLVTILGGLFFGLSLSASVEFSFLLGVVTLLAATSFKAVTSGRDLAANYDILALAIGFFAAWLSALAAVRWMVSYLNRRRLSVFGWYRIGLAAIVACCLYLGWIVE